MEWLVSIWAILTKWKRKSNLLFHFTTGDTDNPCRHQRAFSKRQKIDKPVIVLTDLPHCYQSLQVLVGLVRVDVVQWAAVPGVSVRGCEVNGHLVKRISQCLFIYILELSFLLLLYSFLSYLILAGGAVDAACFCTGYIQEHPICDIQSPLSTCYSRCFRTDIMSVALFSWACSPQVGCNNRLCQICDITIRTRVFRYLISQRSLNTTQW